MATCIGKRKNRVYLDFEESIIRKDSRDIKVLADSDDTSNQIIVGGDL